ncbi:probable disease resistance At5g63020, partial [Olea europaea subsp. europaea]
VRYTNLKRFPGSHMANYVEMARNALSSLSIDLEKNTNALKRKIEVLTRRKDDVHTELQNAIYHPRKKCKIEVEDWLNNAESIIEDFETLNQEVRCCRLFKRQKLAEKVELMTTEVTELVKQSDFPREIFVEVDESIGPLILTPQHNGQAFLQNFDDIWASLMDDSVLSIGIYGMGGVGKTTLALHVHDKLLKESTFLGHVYWVTVSQEFSIHKLQNDIAGVLKLDFSCESDERKMAAKLFRAFKERGRFVLILDGVWNQIDVEKIGIPVEMSGCKLIITSRSKEVCDGMDCQRIIKVNTLSEQEASELFLKKLGRVELHPEVERIHKKMVKRCGGLPLALVTLAGSMRGVTGIYEWRDALEGLEESCMRQANMEDKVLSILSYSYDRLGDEKLKNCLLRCSLYPEDYCIPIVKLIEDFISEELMERRSSFRAEIDQGRAILNKLERPCLLERGSTGTYVKMHDLIRCMAIKKTKDNPRYMKLPNSISDLENLRKLLLKDCYELELVPSLEKLKELRHLDLTATSIEELPPGMDSLTKLRFLYLSCHKLKVLPTQTLRRLSKLQLLSLPFHICAPIEEVEALKQLEVFKGRLNSVCDISRLLKSRQSDKQLSSYRLFLNSEESCKVHVASNRLHCKLVHFEAENLVESSSPKDENLLPRDIEKLIFMNSFLGSSLLDEFPILNSARDLKFCIIAKEDKIECIMRFSSAKEEQSSGAPFESLQSLSLENLPNFFGLFKWEAVAPLPHGTFSWLDELTIKRWRR